MFFSSAEPLQSSDSVLLLVSMTFFVEHEVSVLPSRCATSSRVDGRFCYFRLYLVSGCFPTLERLFFSRFFTWFTSMTTIFWALKICFITTCQEVWTLPLLIAYFLLLWSVDSLHHVWFNQYIHSSFQLPLYSRSAAESLLTWVLLFTKLFWVCNDSLFCSCLQTAPQMPCLNCGFYLAGKPGIYCRHIFSSDFILDFLFNRQG